LQGKFRAVVIDDVDLCREILTEFLESRGYLVWSYSDVTSLSPYSGRKARCLESTYCPDVLLIDNRMPYMNGLDFLKWQLDSECNLRPAAKAIFSGTWTEAELRKSERLGCRIFHKPYDFGAIEDWLDEQEMLILASE
jgi:CheY-like chemotaxis protein